MEENNKINNPQENETTENIIEEKIEEVVEKIDDAIDNVMNEETIEDDSASEEVEIKEEKPKKNKKKRKKYKGIKALILTIVIVGIAVGLAYTIIEVGSEITGINKPDKIVYVEIPQGATTTTVASILKENDVINSELTFRIMSRLLHADGKYHYGSFELNPSHTYDGIISKLTTETNAVDTVDVTIPEGKTLNQIALILEENGVCYAHEFIEATEQEFSGKYEFQSKVFSKDKVYYQSEGYLFPDTYTFYVDEDVESVKAKLYSNFNKKVTSEMYTRMSELGITLDQLISLASLIQGESASDDQMANISSVFWNRLNEPTVYPKLQSDVTNKYIEEDLKPLLDSSKPYDIEEFLKTYDTYNCIGLPAGPVNNPGLTAIKAALYPADTNYYYFCHNTATGEVYYAVTLNEHNRNLVKAGLR